ncbi:hypothetical protein [Pseudomonas sp. SCB32]|uniref:hypothetical protein n=1 Tax=Pseudomonas sp. SCB32 TaxID=2653853 RepID=UPI001265940C|nr:hypothetical protein [Pseudomonas sp. SCB32]
MGTVISLGFAALFLYFAFGLLRRLFRWAFRRNGKPLRLDPTELNEAADEVGKTSRVLAFAGVAAANAAAPTGLAAIGAKIGLVSVPLIVVIAPHLGAAAGIIFVVCCAVSLYAKRKRRAALADPQRNRP